MEERAVNRQRPSAVIAAALNSRCRSRQQRYLYGPGHLQPHAATTSQRRSLPEYLVPPGDSKRPGAADSSLSAGPVNSALETAAKCKPAAHQLPFPEPASAARA